jgi:hypothetical protein
VRRSTPRRQSCHHARHPQKPQASRRS